MKRTTAERRTEAEVRQAATKTLTPLQRIARLDSRLGLGLGASRERARLTTMRETS